MKRFIIEKSDSKITSNSGLALIGAALSNHTQLSKDLNTIPLRHGLSHSDLISSYLGLLSLGKNDFEAINPMQGNDFYQKALNLTTLPTVDRLRQRMDERAVDYLPLTDKASIDFLASTQATLTPLPMGHIPLDADVTPMDNSGTKKEGVSFTYKKFDGYAPMIAYLGQEGYCVGLELREGKQHSQKNTPAFLAKTLEKVRLLTEQPILLRLDGGFDAVANVDVVLEFNHQHPSSDVDFIIKWNPRKKEPEKWLEIAEKKAYWKSPRPGKRVGIFVVDDKRTWKGHDYTIRRVMRLTERTIDKYGQRLLVPEIVVEGWLTSLWDFSSDIIALYNDHGTSEQFHSELKTDMDVERLPSGKFSTNALIMSCSALMYNILRYIGQEGLTGPDAPFRHCAKRRRIKTVMQELMYLASKLVETSRRLKIIFGSYCRVESIFRRLYDRLAY